MRCLLMRARTRAEISGGVSPRVVITPYAGRSSQVHLRGLPVPSARCYAAVALGSIGPIGLLGPISPMEEGRNRRQRGGRKGS